MAVRVRELASAELADHAALPHPSIPDDDHLDRCLKVLNERHVSLPTSPSATCVAQCHPCAPTYSQALVLRVQRIWL